MRRFRGSRRLDGSADRRIAPTSSRKIANRTPRLAFSPRRMLIESLEERQVLAGTPVITEFMAMNTTTLADEDGAFSDWIEIHNPDAAPLSLSGWHLTDNNSQLGKWTFPAITLNPNQYLTVFASSKDRLGTGPGGEYHTNFSLGVNGEYLALVHPDATTIAQEFISNAGEYPQQYANISYGLAPVTSAETYFLTPTPGAANGGPTSQDPGKRIVINEIMYHPASENAAEEYVELFNNGPTAVDVTGWQLTKGANFTIPGVDALTPRMMNAGDYLVIAANRTTFLTKYPTVNPNIVVGDWVGQLSDRYETVQLEDATGANIDQVDYANEGDWGDRVRGPLLLGHQGWIWSAAHNAGGKSLELIDPALSNNQGQNWDASVPNEGTPGAVNSVHATNIAPLVLHVSHFPLVPHTADPVTITAELRDELTTGVTATLFWRLDHASNSDPFTQAAMFDDGAHGDGAAGDGVFGASIPAQANNAIVEYYVRGRDAALNTRTWPAPTDGIGTQGANALYQVDNSFTGVYAPGDQPSIRLIMTEDERAELADIGDSNQNPANETNSDALMNGTFIVLDGSGTDARYNVGIRNRGGSSRVGPPNNYHVSLARDDLWLGESDLTINAYYPQSQVIGAATFQAAGQPSGGSTVIQVRVNNANLAESGNRMNGHYVLNEVRNTDYVNHHFPGDAEGNLYTITNDFGDQGDLRYEGTNPIAYQDAYYKQTNEVQDDWSDLIHMTDVLNNSPDATFLSDISTVIDVNEWFRHLAVDTLLANREGGLATGQGDDFLLYSGVVDPRFKLLPHDMDTLLGQGGSGFQANSSIFVYDQVHGLNRLLNSPQTLPIYFSQLLDVMTNVMAPEKFNPLVDELLGGWVPAATVTTIKNNAAARSAYVQSIIPTALTVTTSLTSLGGIPRTTNGTTVGLSGVAPVAKTRSLLVDGHAATWNPRTGAWTMNTLPTLNPGLNRVMVQAFDGLNGSGEIVAEQFIDIWYDGPAGTTLSGTIASNRTLTAAAGPYHVTGTVTVPAGVTLTIEPGTSLFFDSGTQLTISGQLIAEGTQYDQIRFTRVPNTTNNWDGVQLLNTMQDNRISWAVLEWSSPTVNSNQGMLGVQASNLTVDHTYFDHAERRRVRSRDSSLIIRNSYFADIFATGVAPSTDNISEHVWGGGIPAGGHWIVDNNHFGLLKGHNDAVDFDSSLTAGGPVAQIINNTFAGGGDDATDMLGYVYIAGNKFLNFHKDQYNLDPGQSNSNSSSSGDYTSVRNIYYNLDHVTLTKETAFTTFENNTVYGPDYSAIYFDLAGQTSGPGRGAAVDGSIFADLSAEGLFAEVLPTTQLSLNRSIVPASDVSRGVGNISADPHFVDVAALDFRLRPGSPAIGTGPNGLDMGALVPEGATIGGQPAPVTPLTSATLTVDGPGITHYKYSVDGGPFSATVIPVTTALQLDSLALGPHTVRVIGKNAAGVWQAEAAAASRSWTIQSAASLPTQVVINEILASNSGAVALGATHPDVIELYNAGDVATDLGGYTLSDNPNNPTKYTFPVGTMIPARGYLVLYADSEASQAGELHTGFSFRSEGEGLYLYAPVAGGGGQIDRVEFGLQLDNLSIGRLPGGGDWGLTQPTFGAANRAQPLGDAAKLKINEWFTKGSYTIGATSHSSDFFELYNSENLPVAMGGLHVTDNPADDPQKHSIAALSFIPAGGYSVFLADDQPQDGANHVNFQLSHFGGWIGVMNTEGQVIDQVLYTSQLSNYSQGRVPDGGTTYQFFAQPTPGLDSSPPSVPTNLQFTLNTPTRVDLAWSASTDPQSGVSEYRIYRGGVLLASTTNLSYSDTTVTAGNTYVYQVTAVNGDGAESAHSASISTGQDNTPPSVPGNLHVTFATVAGTIRVDLNWSASSDPQSGLDHYTVYRNNVAIGTPTGTTFSDTSLPLGGTVTYRVSASNTNNVESVQSQAAFVAMFQEGSAGYVGTTDTWINGNNGATNQNNGATTSVRFDGQDPLEEVALIRWDLSSLPADAAVTSAAMTVNITDNTAGQNYGMFPLLRSWAEGQATWINAATGTAWQTAGARGALDRGTTELGTIGASATGVQTYVLNASGVTQVQQWVTTASTNQGIVIAPNDAGDTNGGIFDSSEGTNANNRPRFLVAYTTAPPVDTTPPSVPLGLAATSNGASTINLTWSFSTDNESGVVSYNVFRNGVQIGSSATTAYADTGRTPGVIYNYTVSAVNGAGLESTASTPPLAASIPIDATPPTAPTNVAATDDGISQISLSWTAAADAQSGVASYKIFRDGAQVGTSNTASFVDTGRAANVNYSYQITAVNGQNLTGPQSTPPLVHKIVPLPLTLKLQTRDSYLPGVPVLVRVEIDGADGKPDRTIWDATAAISSSNPAVTLSSNTVQLRNGIGSVLVTFNGNGSFTLNATANGLNASKSFTSLAGVAQTNFAGTLPGLATNWSGIVHVTGDVTVPAGHTLTIQPGTLVLIDGTATPLSTTGFDIIVVGAVNSLGTAASPVTITATNPTAPWGEINHTSSQPSLYQYTDITRGGHSPRGGHTNTGPAIRTANSTITLEHSAVTDIAGKTMQGDGSNLVFRDTIFSRSVMGPELDTTGLLMEDGYIFDMLGIYREDGVTDDDDGIYVHRQGAGQTIRFSGGVIAHTDDDGIDTLGPDVTVENMVIRDLTNTNDDPKGITIIEGTNVIRNVLMANVDIGISIKAQDPAPNVSTNTLDHVTIVANSIAIQAENKFGIAVATLNYNVKNSILRAPDGVRTDYDPAQITINYSDVSEVWPGTGNITADPLFVSATNNFRLQAASPAIDAGDPASPVDADGSRTDMGFYSFFHHPRVNQVTASGSGWSSAFRDRIAADGLGDAAGYSLALGGSPTLLPFSSVDRISVRFTEAVSVTTSDLVLHGVNTPSYNVTGVTYDPATFTATWSLAAPIGVDKLLIRVRDTVLDATGGSLDGEPNASFPSGNGTPGGDFTLRFDVLPGDANRDGVVNTVDAIKTLKDGFRDASFASYALNSDIDGNGFINTADGVNVRDRIGTSLPAGAPSSPSAPASVLASAVDRALASAAANPNSESKTRRASLTARRVRMADSSAAAADHIFSGDNLPTNATTLRATRC